MRLKILTIVVFVFAFEAVQAQRINYNNTRNQKETNKEIINWLGIKTIRISDDEFKRSLYFDGATYLSEEDQLPYYFKIIKINSEFSNVSVKIINPKFQQLEESEIKQIKELRKINGEIKVNSHISVVRKIPYANYSFIPIRKNPQSGQLEKLISFETDIQITPQPDQNSKTRYYAANSVLASGDWYKVYTTYEGIHKITYGDLVNMGINVSSINPKNIRIYGNGGAMLPEKNSDFRYDDLQENAIYVYGENDGHFDQNDYILFYSVGHNKWNYNSTLKSFNHQNHLYSNKSCYFVNTDIGQGKRISHEASTSQAATNTVSQFNERLYHEKDSLNLIKTGREWYGEKFDIIRTFNFPFSIPNIYPGSRVRLSVNVAARSVSATNNSFTINANGSQLTSTLSPVGGDYNDPFAVGSTDTISFISSNSNINISITFNNTSSSSSGWLNYLEINAIRQLKMHGNQMLFRDISSIGPGNISEFILTNASSETVIWDVTNFIEPKEIGSNLNGNVLNFRLGTDSLREFVAHNGNYYYSTTFVGKVANQNLHATAQKDMIIVCHASFIDQAKRLAEFHQDKDGLSVLVVEPAAIYNEFSSGIQDISAIRDFIKMFYERAGSDPKKLPKYLLLFGDGSYDNRDRIANNTNYIPTFQSRNSLNPGASYVTDDFYGLLDDNEGYESNGNLDIGIGRFPVQTLTEATNMVDKVIRYTSNGTSLGQSSGCNNFTSGIPNLGDWRNVVCFVADDEDSNTHINDAEKLARYLDTTYQQYNIDKIYFDAYSQISTPGGQRYPDVKDAINKRVDKGALLVDYIGHGGEVGWSHEAVLEIADINSWTNKNNMPVFLTATCEFSRFDDPGRTSAGELVFLNSNGGAIAMFTTTRLAYSNTNYLINYYFFRNAFKKVNGEYLRMGDLICKAKVESGSPINNRNFILLGDPALQLAYPENTAFTTQINGATVSITSIPDTLKALSKVTITGFVGDENGIKKQDFNGILYPTVFDKAATLTTRANDPASYPKNFQIQKNILYKGKASISNGDFSFSFIVPKDIAYKFDFGKISYYAANDETDASGYFKNVIIGGSSDNPIIDNTGPEIDIFMNDDSFVFGGVTDEKPLLLCYVADSNGVNTVGNGIGHDIVAILDANTEKSIVLNDYYEADLDSYSKGKIRYPFSDLDEGTHNLKVKVWDVMNNSSEAFTEFVVSESAELALKHVLNYPNPFTTKTSFYFEHNQPCNNLAVQIQIFTISGKLLKTIDEIALCNGYRSEPIIWDAKDDFGDRIGKGVYIYKLKVKTTDGKYSEKIEKLVILK
ncbi:MAG: type IX secretion system sortase PorU [Saprospiraceae bacterium]|nr:type IX secretion system sortase PorU [Saprospiraceae bacterium]